MTNLITSSIDGSTASQKQPKERNDYRSDYRISQS